MRVGFTGTQFGPQSPEQSYTVIELLSEFYTEGSVLHHGKCIGWDDQAARFARVLGYRLAGHPPIMTSKVCSVVSDFEYPPLNYIERDHRIVDDTQLLIAAPHTMHEILRSGTWATIRFAVRRRKPGFVVWPNGELTELHRSVSTGGLSPIRSQAALSS